MVALSISFVPLLTVFFLVAFLAFAVVRHKHWGGFAVLAFLLVLIALPSLWLLGATVTYQQDVRVAVAEARAGVEAEAASLRELAQQIAMQEKSAVMSRQSDQSQPTMESAAEVASDEELAAVASSPPKIDLEAVSVPTSGPADGAADDSDPLADPKSDRPDWIDAHLGDNQKLIVAGPFTTKESCEADTQKQLAAWLGSRYGAEGTTLHLTPYIKSQHDATRETSVGEMHFLYTLAEVTPEAEAQLAKSLAEAAAQVARTRGVRAVSFAGAGVLSLVALTHVVLRSGGRKPKTSAA